MYEFTSLERPSVPAGTSLLLVGSDGRTREKLVDAMAEARDGEAVLLLSVVDADDVVAHLRTRGVPADALGVVDATGTTRSGDGVAEYASVDGPGALPTLGIEASDRLDRLGHRFDRLRVGLHSATGLLAARDCAAVFRFLHVLSGRINAADATLVTTLSTSAHDEGTRLTLAELFDERIDVG